MAQSTRGLGQLAIHPSALSTSARLEPALCSLCRAGQLHRQLDERVRLPLEKPVGCEGFDCRHWPAIARQGRTDHRTRGQTLAEEGARFGQNLVGLGEFGRGVIEVREGKTGYGIHHARQGRVHRISRLVVPQAEMVDFDSADTEQNPQDFLSGSLQREYWIETRSALLNKRKVESRSVGDGLHAGFL